MSWSPKSQLQHNIPNIENGLEMWSNYSILSHQKCQSSSNNIARNLQKRLNFFSAWISQFSFKHNQTDIQTCKYVPNYTESWIFVTNTFKLDSWNSLFLVVMLPCKPLFDSDESRMPGFCKIYFSISIVRFLAFEWIWKVRSSLFKW